jgi:tetratricopeptide (TPR) repeat protein
MKRVIYTIALILSSLTIMAQGNITKDAGDKAYSEGRYADAIEIYETLVGNNNPSLSLYYNLGNAYFRNNEAGKAILNYERALRVNPNDDDTKENLKFVQSTIIDKVPVDEIPFYKSWGNAFTGILTIDAWAIIGIVSFLLMLVALFIYFFRTNLRRTSLTLAIVFILITFIANISAHSLYVKCQDKSEAVILDEMVVVKSSPDNSGTELTKIHEGLKVKIIDSSLMEWTRIEANNGNRVVGWVKSKSLEKI